MCITYENENARLLFEEVKEVYSGLVDKVEVTEDMALAMYYHAKHDNIPVINEVIHVPIYNIEVD